MKTITIHEGNRYSNSSGTEWKKKCNCAGTASTGRFEIMPVLSLFPVSIQTQEVFIEGPICDVCKTAWEKICVSSVPICG